MRNACNVNRQQAIHFGLKFVCVRACKSFSFYSGLTCPRLNINNYLTCTVRDTPRKKKNNNKKRKAQFNIYKTMCNEWLLKRKKE